MKNFITKAEKIEGVIECTLLNKQIIRGKKILLCSGAYSRIFAEFFPMPEKILPTQVVGGSYLERKIDLGGQSFYLTIDGHNLQYRSIDKNLLIGSASNIGNFTLGDYKKLKDIYLFFKSMVNIPIGDWEDYKVVTGVRHKGVRKRPMIGRLDDEGMVFINSAYYKNGYSLSFYAAKKLVLEIFG